jgi:Protein of unknown function (DUF1295)
LQALTPLLPSLPLSLSPLVTVWTGVFLGCSPAFDTTFGTEWGYISVLSPVYTMFLLTLVSGAPLGEARYNQKFGKNETYLNWHKTTSPFVPLPPSVYTCLPDIIKKTIFCEWSMYQEGLEEAASETDSLV